MRHLLVIGVAFVLLVSSPAQQANADPGPIVVTPDEGEMGTVVHLEQEGWEAGTPINLYVYFAEAGTRLPGSPFRYILPALRLDAGEDGGWSADIQTAEIRDLLHHDRTKSGFVSFRATSADLPRDEQAPNVASFVVIADGVRPDGSGSIQISVQGDLEPSEEPEASLSFRQVGDPFFSYREAVAIPAEGISWGARNGDWEIGLRLPENLGVARSHSVRQLEAPVCSLRCFEASLFVQRVSVQDAGTSDITFVVKERPIYTGSVEDSGRVALIAGASALLAILSAGAVGLGYRRATAS